MDTQKKHKILLVDDDIAVLKKIINILLQNPNYIIRTTMNGKSACEMACLELPDLIIMDWKMPVMNGIEATDELKQNDLTKEIPIIISSGIMIGSNDLQTAMTAGAVDYIRKPIDEVELLARVANMLRISDAYSIIKQQKSELQSQLSSRLINIQQLIELRQATVKQLSKIKDQAITGDIGSIKKEVTKTENILYSKAHEINWNNFEAHFEFIHQGFYKKIQNSYGHFTPNELRIFTFIRLNMTNKEIALITYTSPDSVNTARKRLKKKLGLLPHESLQLFIREL